MRASVLTIALLLLTTPLASAQVDFERDIAPILARRCLSCHSEKEHKGDIRVDTAEEVVEGGIVVPGAIDESLLAEVIQSADGKAPRMPKDSDPLTQSQIDTVLRWIKEGAKWPESVVVQPAQVTDRDWWSLKPLVINSPPRPTDEQGRNWIRTPIDAFLYEAMQQQGLSPSRPADRRVLVRRLTYDLTGLPPTPAEVDAFVHDRSPLAYEQLVDRLLSSPAYGERWARHWLDVVHYADTHGYDKDKLRPNAWPYRDYVVRSFNGDKPYRRFVREQLAGDALYPETVDGAVGTGFIAAGPWDFIGHAEVPETKLDGKVARNLDRDNMVTSAMNTFCSLTIQCARCHNHKLDPITMEDYYRLQAVFASIDRADRDYDRSPDIARRRNELTRAKRDLTETLAQQTKLEKELISPEMKRLDTKLEQLSAATAKRKSTKLPRSAAFGYHSQVADSQDKVKWVQLDVGRPTKIDEIYLFGADEYGFADFGFPHRFRVEAANEPTFSSPQLIASFETDDAPRPGADGVQLNASVTARYVRVTATKLWSRRRKGQPKTRDFIFALGEMSVLSAGRPIEVVEVKARDSIEAAPRWSRAALVDGVYGKHNLDVLAGDAKGSSTNGYHSQFAAKADTEKWINVDLSAPRQLDRIRLVSAFPTDWTSDTPGFGFPRRYRLELFASINAATPAFVHDRSDADETNPGQHAVTIDLPPSIRSQTIQRIRLVATRLWDRGGSKHALAMSELEAFSEGENVARNAQVSASDSIESGRWSKRALVDGFSSRLSRQNLRTTLATLSRSKARDAEIRRLTEQRRKLLRERLGEKRWLEHRRTEARYSEVEKGLESLPKPQRVYAGVVHHGSGAFRGRGGLGPRTIHVLHRGNVDQPGQRVQAGAPPLIPHSDPDFRLGDDEPEWKRRVALADWVTRDDNPLTWRSIVNRIWVHHFGRGLADTPNDFGRGGKTPSHPELLDWLAAEFRDSGGSIKSLHRMIVTSAAYRQRVHDDPQKLKIDSDNQYYWRMNRRRLSAEEVRDSMLLVAGRLNRQQGGPGFMDFVIEQPQHSPHYEYEKHDPGESSSHRRTIYRFIVRSQPQPFMNTLDCADPSISVPKRDETLTSLQALAMLNNQFVIAMAEYFAAELERQVDNPRGRIAFAFRTALSREPTTAESAALTQFAAEHGLANACRLIFNLNEFVFVD